MPARKTLPTLFATLGALALAPADAARGGEVSAGPVAEVVTFRLLPGTDEAAFLAAARATGPLAAAQPGHLGRSLSRGDDGRWTDHVLWSDGEAAQAAAAAVMADPAAAPFMAAIDPATVEMRYEVVMPLTAPGAP